MSRWEQIVEFAESTGIELVFGLNGATRASSTTPLDWSIKNTQNFVTYVAEHNAAAIYGFELGNEKCGQIDPTVYANDIRHLMSLVHQHWQAGEKKPRVIGPDCNPIGGSWVGEFLSNASDGERPFLILPRALAVSLIRNAPRLSVLNVYTYHNCKIVILSRFACCPSR